MSAIPPVSAAAAQQAPENLDPAEPMDEDILARRQPHRNPQALSRLTRRSICTRQEIRSRQ